MSGSRDKSMRVWDVATGEVLKIFHGHTTSVRSASFSADGSRVVSCSNSNSIVVWEATTGEVLNVLDGHLDIVNSVAFSSDGRVVSGSKDSIRV